MGKKRISFQDQLKHTILTVLENNEYARQSQSRDVCIKKTLEDSLESRPAGSRTLKRAVERSDGHSNGLKNGHSNGLKNGHSNGHSVGQRNKQSIEHSKGQSIKQTREQLPPDPFYWITQKQAKVLSFLVEQENRITRLKTISRATGVPYGTARKAIKALVSEKCISQPSRYRKGRFQGFSYSLNEPLCKQFIEWRQQFYSEQDKGHTVGQSNGQSISHPWEQSEERTLLRAVTGTDTISSSIFIKTTTNKDIDKILQYEPELGYWRQKGLTAKQIENWMQQANCSLENMIQYLCYCRFEMVDLGLEDSKPVKKVFDWFFRILERTGAYPKPKGYKSYQQKQLESERQLVEQKEKEAREAEELYRRKVQADQDKKFWDMMNEPEGDLYKQCYDSFSSFQKKHTSGKAFELAMRAAFDNLIEKGTSEFNKGG